MSISRKPTPSSSSAIDPAAGAASSLRRDDSGAILVIYLAAALLLVGFAWAVIAIGQRVYQKEILQTSADAAAFSAAALKAKGLNLLAFCNLLLALLLAIIIFLRLIKYALVLAVIALMVICVIPGGQGSCVLAGQVESFREKYNSFAQKAEDGIQKAMKGITWVENGVNKAFPTLSVIEGWYVGTKSDAYKAGPGKVVTVTWPLPIRQNLTLPTKEGTYDELCDHAIDDVAWVIGKAIGLAVPIPGAEWAITKAAKDSMELFAGILCGTKEGGPKSMDVEQPRTGQCSAVACSGAVHSVWTAQQVIRVKDIEDTQLRERLIAEGHNPGEFYEFRDGTCTLDGFPEWWCTHPTSPKHVTCNDGKVYTRLNFRVCTVKQQETVDTGGELSDKPLPLVLADDWRDRRFVTAFTLLTDDGGAARRRAVGIGRTLTARPGLPLIENGVLTMARAEFYAFNPGHEDLWHMDWRARLVRLKFDNVGETSGLDTGNAPEEVNMAAGSIHDYLDTFKKTVVSAISDGVEEVVIH